MSIRPNSTCALLAVCVMVTFAALMASTRFAEAQKQPSLQLHIFPN